jgi:Holliday junction resolvase RusA-like endonuclease
MRVAGIVPLTRNLAGLKRPSYRAWLATLDEAAAKAARKRKRTDVEFFSVRIQLCLFATKDHHADLDNFVKPILDAMAKHGVFGPTLHVGSSMTGDERVDHLELCRERVHEIKQAGLFVEVRSLASAATAPA